MIGAPPETGPATARPRLGFIHRNLADDWGWLAGIFLTGLGAKFFLIFRFGTPLPFQDQWDAEARGLYLPYLTGKLTFSMLVRPHVEHRMFFTRVYNLALFLLNGQWDGRLEMAANAVLHCAAIAGLGWLLVRLSGRNLWPVIWPPLTLALVLPFAWENTLGGLYSQFYFLLLFSLLTIWLFGLGRPLSLCWWLGLACAGAALFTAASGLLASATVFGLVVLDLLKERRIQRWQLAVLATCALIILAGLLLKPACPETIPFKARSAGDFLTAFGSNLAWPKINPSHRLPWHVAVNLFPLVWLAGTYLRAPGKNLPAEKMILGLGAWSVLQAAAAAYSRGAGGAVPASRYMDSSSLIMIADWLSFVCLLTCHLRPSWFRKLALLLAVVWAVDCLAGLQKLSLATWTNSILERSFEQQLWLKSARAFLATDDPRVLERKRVVERLYPRPEKLALVLRNPEVRAILPACVREPLQVTQTDAGDGSFVPLSAAGTHWDAPSGPGWTFRPRTNHTEGKFESLPLGPSRLPYLEFPVAGELSAGSISFQLVELATGRVISTKLPPMTNQSWTTVCVKAPMGKFKIVAAAAGSAGEFAFKEPREMGRFSYWTICLLAAWKYFLFAGLAGLLVKTGLSSRRQFARMETGFVYRNPDDSQLLQG